MNSKRQNKVSRLIQKELAQIFMTGPNKALITVTMVRVSPDLAQAKAYLSVFFYKDAEDKNSEADLKSRLLEEINNGSALIRKKLGERIGKQLRSVPRLNFFLDDSLDYEENLDRLLGNK